MAWLVVCRDVADSGDLRRQHLARHLAYVESVMDRVAVAGPLLSAMGGDLSGSCFVYHTDDRVAAERLLRDDPYYEAGLYAEVEFPTLRARRRPGRHQRAGTRHDGRDDRGADGGDQR